MSGYMMNQNEEMADAADTVAIRHAESGPVARPPELRPAHELALPEIFNGDWGAGAALEADDVIMPQILLMQGMSDMVVKAGTARPGEFRDSVTGELLTDSTGKLPAIIFDSRKNWRITKKEGKKERFVRTEPVTVDNANDELTWTQEGEEYIRTKVWSFYCLLPRDGTNIAEAFPYVLSLSRTSSRAARELGTIFAKLRQLGRPSAATTIALTSQQRENDNGIFYVVDVAAGRPSTPDEVVQAHTWFKRLNGGVKATVHEAE